MPVANANGLQIAYQLRGPVDGTPLLLIMGFNMTLAAWPEGFLSALERAGLRLILMDNRDAGLSQRMTDSGDLSAVRISFRRWRGRAPRPPYCLSDMANDCAGLLAALNLPNAHVAGISMGGMIAQCLAIGHPERVRSLALLMTHSGAFRHGVPSPRLLSLALQQPGDDAESMQRYALKFWNKVSGPAYPCDPALVAELMGRSARHCPLPNGRRRQLAAIAAGPDRTEQLRCLQMPVVVIHGTNDPLVPPRGGRELARVIPNAKLLLIPGLGHDLPQPLHGAIASAIVDNIMRSRES